MPNDSADRGEWEAADMREKRRRLMADWTALLCESPPADCRSNSSPQPNMAVNEITTAW
jgi:hypothetical protein